VTAIRLAWLSCDVCDESSGDGSLGESRTVREAREVAARDGWHRTRDGRDICPTCWGSRR
jgi:hypothetical protein